MALEINLTEAVSISAIVVLLMIVPELIEFALVA